MPGLMLGSYWVCILYNVITTAAMAEWLRRWTWNPLGSSRAGSNPVRSEIYFICLFNKCWWELCVTREIIFLHVFLFRYAQSKERGKKSCYQKRKIVSIYMYQEVKQSSCTKCIRCKQDSNLRWISSPKKNKLGHRSSLIRLWRNHPNSWCR